MEAFKASIPLQHRNGSILTSTTIIKSDQFVSFSRGIYSKSSESINILGAPNFREARHQIFGVAQPTVSGLKTLLRLLCPSKTSSSDSNLSGALWINTREEPLVYINGRPFVLRSDDSPFENVKTYAGISQERLEKMEDRLKADIIKEASLNKGLFLIHEEVSEHHIIPFLTAIETVQTCQEISAELVEEGLLSSYNRVPVSRELSLIDAYMDDFITLFSHNLSDIPVLISCGIGIGRTTFSMIISYLLRVISTDIPSDPSSLSSRISNPTPVLRMVSAIERAIRKEGKHLSDHSRSRNINWSTLSVPQMDLLIAAIQGNYQIILELTKVLENGPTCKKMVDLAIDECGELINIREQILIFRIQYEIEHLVEETDEKASSALSQAIGYLERYFSLIAFMGFVQEKMIDSEINSDSSISMDGKSIISEEQSPIESKFPILIPKNTSFKTFGDWIRGRQDIWNMLQSLRKNSRRIKLLRPADSLDFLMLGDHKKSKHDSSFKLSRSLKRRNGPSGFDDPDEYNVVQNRDGLILGTNTILKNDHWYNRLDQEAIHLSSSIKGAPNFRAIFEDIYVTSQPTIEALKNIFKTIRHDHSKTLCWITVREEPLIYINDEPYVLRDRYSTLRNIKSFSGISKDRLEGMEEKLKNDILVESKFYNEKILVHCEVESLSTEEGNPPSSIASPIANSTTSKLSPSWVSLDGEGDVQTTSDLFAGFKNVSYYRIPMTAEEAPEPINYDQILDIVYENWNGNVCIFNCQMGTSRSTMSAIILQMIINCKESDPLRSPEVLLADIDCSRIEFQYHCVHTIIRLIPNGIMCKKAVDNVIDMANHLPTQSTSGAGLNFRHLINDLRFKVKKESSKDQVDQITLRRLKREQTVALKRYCTTILFQAYLNIAFLDDSSNPDETFTSWFSRHEEFKGVFDDLDRNGCVEVSQYIPLSIPDMSDLSLRSSTPLAPSFKQLVTETILSRKGSVLSSMSILKFDHFPGCQKSSLQERVMGAPNFRNSILSPSSKNLNSPIVVGCAMPTKEGVANTLDKLSKHNDPMNGIKDRNMYHWFCLREEPVIYLQGRPFVLRILKDPVVNLEMTGIISERVAMMENRLKNDVINELIQFKGQLLVHEEDPSSGEIVPVWEAISSSEVMTPEEMMTSVQNSYGYQNLHYYRLPITDEQAPTPSLFDALLSLNWSMVRGTGNRQVIIYNCQMGRGRTTTGMVISSVMYYVLSERGEDIHKTQALFFKESSKGLKSRYLSGWYKVVIKLLQLLERGVEAKKLVDSCIDSCMHIQNLRMAIYDYRLNFGLHDGRGINYLMRYMFLIIFSNFLLEQPELKEKAPGKHAFSDWINERRELLNIIRRSQIDLS